MSVRNFINADTEQPHIYKYKVYKVTEPEAEKNETEQVSSGIGEKRVNELLAYSETQTGEEVVAEDGAAFEDSSQTFKEIPDECIPKVRELIAKQVA